MTKSLLVDYSSDVADQMDLRERITSEISASNYTCLVCTDYITPTSQIWCCSNCYRVFDLDCIKDWASRGGETWRCPSCNFDHFKRPKKYTCWCGKSVNPTVNYLEPHSCGNQCSSPLSTCYHDCTLTCHPGPHIEKCTSLGPNMKCHCGKHTNQAPCINTPYETGWNCGDICNDILPCGQHKCEEKCHKGFCGDCKKVLYNAKCYCGKTTSSIKCEDKLPKLSKTDTDSWIGIFQCENICEEVLDCGIHKCHQNCHAVSNGSHKCPNSPKSLTHCPCGKSKVNDLINSPRISCLDEIPTCDQICGKRLPCGHKCYWKCHTGECAPCYRPVDIDCLCGSTHYSIACKLNVQGYMPTCFTKCNAKFNCRRHYCSERCCSFRKLAFDRANLIKKQLRNNVITNAHVNAIEFEPVHTCTKICDQLLSCGKHRCKQTCHPGPCPPCLESSSEDLVCHCQRTVVPAPVRCGTSLPICPYQCIRPKDCGHPPEPHHCHEDNVACPKCTTLVTKTCQCEKHKLVANVMCYQTSVSCYLTCNKLLPCGEHKCTKKCHKPGECQVKCLEKCNKPKSCGHLCQKSCHAGKACDEKTPCTEMVKVPCKCGRRNQPLYCYALKKMKEEEGVDFPTIECDDICEKEKRNKLLIEALGLTSERAKETQISMKMRAVEETYTPYVLSVCAKQKVWAESIESIFSKLLSETLETKINSMDNLELKQSHHFRPMKEMQRRFIHELAEAWALFSEAHDQEPKRSVFVKLLKNSKAPDISLAEALQIMKDYKAYEQKRAEEKSRLMQVCVSHLTTQKDENTERTSFYNGIVIKDVFFGVTVDKVDAAIYDIWNKKEEELQDIRKFNLIDKAKVEYINDSMYVFYCEMDIENVRKAEYEKQIIELSILFEQRLKDRNLAMKCIPVIINLEENTITDFMPDVEIQKHLPDQEDTTTEVMNSLVDDLDDLKIETVDVSSEWW